MRPAAPETLLLEGLEALSLPSALAPRLLAFVAELEKWNFAYNLTAIRDPAEMVTRHVLDSLAVLPLLKGRVLDVGAGAGLPCIPLAIAAPGLQLTGLDSNGKKARFMRHAQRTLKLDNLAVIEGRVEAVPAAEGYGVVTSRAFASLADFFTLTQHLVAADGVWVAMKGKLEPDEQASIPAGVELLEVRRLSVPGLNEARHAVIAKKRA
jgi:16S rRNA (guanine527-N7)-methyltransferase